MQFLIDTCTWIKLDKLQKLKEFSTSQLYLWGEVQITHEVLKEINHFRVLSCIRKDTTILPIGNRQIYDDATSTQLDEADASLLSNGARTQDKIIISEDPGLLNFARLYRITALQLIDLFQFFTEGDYLTRRELYRHTRTLRDLKNITKKRQKEIKSWLITH